MLDVDCHMFPVVPPLIDQGQRFTLFTPPRAGSITTPTNSCLSACPWPIVHACGAASPLSPVTVHVGNIDNRNAEGGPAGNEGSASSSEP